MVFLICGRWLSRDSIGLPERTYRGLLRAKFREEAVINEELMGFPGGWDSKEFCLQCRRPGFDPCVRKIPWRSEQLPTPVSLPRESQGQRSLAGYSPQGHRGRHDWVTKHTHTQKEDEPEPDSTEATRKGKPAVWLNSCCNLGHGVDSFMFPM